MLLASILQEAGYKVGLYTSPHLSDFRERIRINGVPIDQEYILDFVVSNRIFFEQEAFSFFEMTVGLAFDYFAKHMRRRALTIGTRNMYAFKFLMGIT